MSYVSNDPAYRGAVYGSTATWRERLGRYRLQGSACTACGEVFFPRRQLCPMCGDRNLMLHDCSPHGSVETVSSFPAILNSPSFRDQVPRIAAVIALDDGPSVMGQIVDADPLAVRPGVRVSSTLRRLGRESNGNVVYGYKFVVSPSGDDQTEVTI